MQKKKKNVDNTGREEEGEEEKKKTGRERKEVTLFIVDLMMIKNKACNNIRKDRGNTEN